MMNTWKQIDILGFSLGFSETVGEGFSTSQWHGAFFLCHQMSLDGLKNYVTYLVICILWTLYGGEMTIIVQDRVLFYVTKTVDNEKELETQSKI